MSVDPGEGGSVAAFQQQDRRLADILTRVDAMSPTRKKCDCATAPEVYWSPTLGSMRGSRQGCMGEELLSPALETA
jgi:hypothetical protein